LRHEQVVILGDFGTLKAVEELVTPRRLFVVFHERQRQRQRQRQRDRARDREIESEYEQELERAKERCSLSTVHKYQNDKLIGR